MVSFLLAFSCGVWGAWKGSQERGLVIHSFGVCVVAWGEGMLGKGQQPDGTSLNRTSQRQL